MCQTHPVTPRMTHAVRSCRDSTLSTSEKRQCFYGDPHKPRIKQRTADYVWGCLAAPLIGQISPFYKGV